MVIPRATVGSRVAVRDPLYKEVTWTVTIAPFAREGTERPLNPGDDVAVKVEVVGATKAHYQKSQQVTFDSTAVTVIWPVLATCEQLDGRIRLPHSIGDSTCPMTIANEGLVRLTIYRLCEVSQ